MLKPLVILSLALTFTGCATNSSNSTAITDNSQKAVAEKEEAEKEYICRRVSTIGSHFREKKCWTKEEYAKRKEEDRETLQNVRDRQLGGSLPVENK